MNNDTAWLAATHALCFPESRGWSVQEFAALTDAKGAHLISRAQGFALARAVLDEAEVLSIAVLPEARRRGVGREMLAALEMQMTGAGIRKVFLEVSENNPAAVALYYGAGYRETGRRSGYYRAGDAGAQDALILSKLLF